MSHPHPVASSSSNALDVCSGTELTVTRKTPLGGAGLPMALQPHSERSNAKPGLALIVLIPPADGGAVGRFRADPILQA